MRAARGAVEFQIDPFVTLFPVDFCFVFLHSHLSSVSNVIGIATCPASPRGRRDLRSGVLDLFWKVTLESLNIMRGQPGCRLFCRERYEFFACLC